MYKHISDQTTIVVMPEKGITQTIHFNEIQCLVWTIFSFETVCVWGAYALVRLGASKRLFDENE